jgi:16S rRNA (guanine(966)-N(2))-methyltransferase RsmD
MRIIAGTLKGRRLEAPTWDGLRPTSDKLRETLFNVLAPRIQGARVVDAFAGTGALGLEAISRGASFAAFIEQDRRAQALIARNLAACGVSDGYAMIPASIARGVEMLRADPAFEPFDIILLDPPYDSQPVTIAAAEPVETLMRLSALLAPGGIMVLEHAKRRPAPEAAGPLALTRRMIAGDSALAYYAWRR